MLLSLSGDQEKTNAAGFTGNQFYSDDRVGLVRTAPNVAYNSAVDHIDNDDFPGWYYGKIDDFKDAFSY